MVRLEPEFVDKIRKEIETQASPERSESRKLLKTGGRKCITLRPGWCRQWNLETGSKVLLFIDENGRLVITPATETWKNEMGKKYQVHERKIVEVGNSLAVSLPSNILKEKLEWDTEKLLRSSYYTTTYEPYNPEREDKIKKGEINPEIILTKEVRRRKKSQFPAIATLLVFIIGMGLLVMVLIPETEETIPNVTLNFEGKFEETLVIEERLQLSPSLLKENHQDQWEFSTPNQEPTTTEKWEEWYTIGTHSAAIGSIRDEWYSISSGNHITGTTEIDLTDVDTLLIDIYGDKTFPRRGGALVDEYIHQEVMLNGETVHSAQNENFLSTEHKVDVSDKEDEHELTIQIRNEWGGSWPSPILAVDGIRSQELANDSGSFSSDWVEVEDRNWENIEIDAEIPETTGTELTLSASNDGETVNESESFDLEDGKNNFDIDVGGDYARFEIEMSTDDLENTPRVGKPKLKF